MLSKNLLITALLLVISYAPAAFSQAHMNNSFKSAESNLSINESNLYCFQTLQCLKEVNPFKNSNLDNVKLNQGTEKYVVEGKSKNEELYAEYNGSNGNLIKATVIQRNIILPRNIMAEITTGDYNGWTMVGNKRVIKNFMKDTIEYEVVMMKDGELRIEYFDSNGMMIDQLI
ncbi:hypothetical protein [Rhodohalobacter sp. 8-1]|uniref:hypothetical protein n=1 Tax=Rhodohalobacter sp. 8-1 TaxID=3131972 RepID=UPI0030ECF218